MKDQENTGTTAASSRLSRREMLSSIGLTGLAIAGLAGTGSVFGASTVTEAVYGSNGNDEGSAVKLLQQWHRENPERFVNRMQALFAHGLCTALTLSELRQVAADPGGDSMYYVTDKGQEGLFLYDAADTVSPDNNGTVIVSAAGFRFLRIWSGEINVQWFGAKGNGNDDDTAALIAAIQACQQNGGGTVWFPPGRYICTDTLVVPSGVRLLGSGLDEWVPSAQNIVKHNSKGTHLIFTGTGPKTHSLYGITDMNLAGGKRANPDQSGQYYQLTNFHLDDAAGNQPASPRLFSAAVVIEDAVQSGISQLRIHPDYRGLDGYNSSTDAGFGADWDIGLWLKNASQGRYQRIQVVGYWRMYGVLVTSMNDPDLLGDVPTAESNRFDQCVMSGKVGMGFRSGDVYRCLEAAPSTVTIPWSKSNPYRHNGGMFRVGTTNYSYTGTSRVNNTIRLNGVTPDPAAGGVSVGSEIRTSASNFGYAGTVIQDCYISGFDHSSGVMCTNSSLEQPFVTPSSCLEISGEPVRGLHFINCTIQTRDEVLFHMHDARDVEFIGCYFESKSSRSSIGTSFSIPSGARMIASPFVGNSTAEHPAGETNGLVFLRCSGTNTVICRQPLFKRNGTTKFSPDSGLFNPRGYYDDARVTSSVTNVYPVQLPKSTPLAVSDFHGNRLGMVGYNENGEFDLRSGSGGFRIRNDSVTRLLISPSEINVYGTTRPNVDNTLSLGTSSQRWKDIFVANGTINTSDAREKEQVKPLNGSLEVIRKLRPVSFKFKDYEETVVDDEGKEEVKQHVFNRRHFGLIAQEVKTVFEKMNIDAGAYVYDREADRHGLRYTEFVPILIKAVQELSEEVERLSARLEAKESG